jgi:hypothetical protein
MNSEPRFTPQLVAWSTSLLCVGLAFCAALAAPLGASPLTAYVFGFACVAGAALAVGRFAPGKARVVVPILLSALAVLGLAFVYGARAGWPAALAVSIALLAAGTSLGALVGARIQHSGHLLFVALASALADVFSVTSPEGPSAAISKSDVALSVAAVAWPMLGTGRVEPFLGAGDIVFTGLYIATARKHELSMRRTLIALAAGYVATMLCVVAFQVAIPALPFLGGAMLIAHPEARRPPAADRRRGFVALSVIAAVFLALLLRPHE